MALQTWHKVAIGAGVVVGGYVLYNAGKKKGTKKKKKVVKEDPTSPPPGAPIPTPDAPIPQPPGPEAEPLEPGPQPVPAGAAVFPAAQSVQEQAFATSDNAEIPAPVEGIIFENPDKTYMVRFNHAAGKKDYHHLTLDGAQLRLDSMVNMPAGWTCQAGYDNEFDAWVCTAGINPDGSVVRGFFDTPQGAAPWWVGWNGDKFVGVMMTSVAAPIQEVGQFDTILEAVQAVMGTQ